MASLFERSSTLTFQDFKDAKWPATTWTPIIIAIVFYVGVLYGLRQLMKNREKFELGLIVPLHNFFLCGLSLVMGLGLFYELVKLFVTSTDVMDDFFCDTKKRLATGPQNYWMYIFLLSKFYELLDTVIIVLKKRPLIFLHVYHHIITMVLVFVMMDSEVAVRWLPMVANCSVHVPMYYYYGISALGMTAWWKIYITQMQIIQFVVDIIGIYIGGYYHYLGYNCSSSVGSWFFGQSIIVSFLVLFLNFYSKTYTPKKKSDAPRGNSDSDSSSDNEKRTKSPTLQKRVRKEE